MPVQLDENAARKRSAYEEVARTFGRQAENDFKGQPRPARSVDALTLDTNVVRDFWDQRPRKGAIERLLELAREGAVSLVVTRYIEDDIPDGALRERIGDLQALEIRKTGGLLTLDKPGFFGSDFFGSDAFLECQAAFAGWRPSKGKPPDDRDWNHLHAHYAKRRDYFLTWDGPLLELGAILEAGFPLGTIAPDDYLELRSGD